MFNTFQRYLQSFQVFTLSMFTPNTVTSSLDEFSASQLEQRMDDMALSPRKGLKSMNTNSLRDSTSIPHSALQNRDIPTEIWLGIFRYAVEMTIQGHISAPLQLNQRLVPPSITLSHVCRRWRSIVHDLPELWSTIPTCPREWWTKNDANTMEFVRQGAEGAFSQSDTTRATTKPVTLLLDVSERFDSKEATSLDYKARVTVPVVEPTRTLEGRKSLTFPKGGHNVYIFLRPANPDVVKPGPKLHPNLPIQMRHIVRIGGGYYSKPSSLTLHWPRRGEFSPQISSLFYNYQPTHVTLIDYFPEFPWEAGPQTIKTVRLKTTERQRLVPINGMLRPWIEELYVHSCFIDVERNGPYLSAANRTLHNLRVLGITPVHVALLTEISLPGLEKVIFYPPNIKPRSRKLGEEWLATLGDAIKSINKLEFEGWPQKYQRNVPYYSVVPLLLGLLHQLPKLSNVVCRQSYVWGEGLAGKLPLALADANGVRLEEIAFDECTGLTRTHCDQLAGSVGSIRII